MSQAELPYGVPDLMMEELRAAREQIQETLESLPPEVWDAWFARAARDGLGRAGYELKSHPTRRNASVIIALDPPPHGSV